MSWLENSQVYVEALTLEGNERQSLLIDGPATGNIVSISLTGGDEAKPPLQQNLVPGGEQPMLGGDVSLMSQATRAFAVPRALVPPSALP